METVNWSRVRSWLLSAQGVRERNANHRFIERSELILFSARPECLHTATKFAFAVSTTHDFTWSPASKLRV
jgi:hypothetical protein